MEGKIEVLSRGSGRHEVLSIFVTRDRLEPSPKALVDYEIEMMDDPPEAWSILSIEQQDIGEWIVTVVAFWREDQDPS